MTALTILIAIFILIVNFLCWSFMWYHVYTKGKRKWIFQLVGITAYIATMNMIYDYKSLIFAEQKRIGLVLSIILFFIYVILAIHMVKKGKKSFKTT
jgi:hypothetical protein